MFSEKLKLLQFGMTDEERVLMEKRKAVSEEIKAKKLAILHTSKTKGWEILMKYFDARVDELKSRLVRKDDKEARAEIKAVMGLKNFISQQTLEL